MCRCAERRAAMVRSVAAAAHGARTTVRTEMARVGRSLLRDAVDLARLIEARRRGGVAGPSPSIAPRGH